MNLVTRLDVVDIDGEICIEWWRGSDKYTLYAHPSDLIHVDAAGNVKDGNIVELMKWLRE